MQKHAPIWQAQISHLKETPEKYLASSELLSVTLGQHTPKVSGAPEDVLSNNIEKYTLTSTSRLGEGYISDMTTTTSIDFPEVSFDLIPKALC